MTRLELLVAAVDDAVPGVRTLHLVAAAATPLPPFPPGAHIVLECIAAEGDPPVANAYSLTGDGICPTEYVVSVLECPDGAGGSRWIHRKLRIGDTVVARPPRSAFAPVLRAARHLLVAAGIGITPMVSHLRAARRWGRDVQLLYVHRAGRGACLDEIKHLTDGRDEVARVFTDRLAFHAELRHALATQPFGAHVYICGPSGFIDDVTELAVEFGWPPSRIHLERFGTDALDPGEPFEVTLTESGGTFTVASGVSLLEALETRGHDIASLCRQGVCGECRIPVCGGDILHRDLYLTENDRQKGDSLMSCVSRAAGGRLEIPL